MATPDTDVMVDALSVPASGAGMDLVHGALAEVWEALGQSRPQAPGWYDVFTIAVAEVAGNIVQYAYAPEILNPRFVLSVIRYPDPDRLAALLVDWGGAAPPVDQALQTLTVPDTIEHVPERGRGLAIVHLVTDHFEYRRTAAGQNHWRLEKHFVA